MKALVGLAAVLALAGAAPAFAAGFAGDTVNGTYYYPDTGSVYEDDGSAVAPTSFFFNTGFPNTTATVGDTQITISFDAGGGAFNGTSFNGPVITDLTSSRITGVTLDAATTLAGFTASDLSFTSNSVSFNLEGLWVPDASNIVVADIQFGGGVPEPATWALMLVGFAGLGATLRSGRKSVTA